MNTELQNNESIFSPSWKAYHGFVLSFTAAVVAFPIAILLTNANGLVIWLGIIVVSIAAAMLIVALYIRYSKVTLAKDTLMYKTILGTKVFKLDENFKGLLARYEDTTGGGIVNSPTMLVLFVTNLSTGKKVKLRGAYWSSENLEIIASQTNSLNLQNIETMEIEAKKYKWDLIRAIEGVTAKQLVKAYPYLFRWRERHSGLFVLIAVVACIAVIAAGVIIIDKVEGIY
jgi:hypothetical protein